jgi:hypothetical protein
MLIVLCENCHGLYDKTDEISFDEVREIRHKIAVEAARSDVYVSYLCEQLVTTRHNFPMNNLLHVMSYLDDAQRTENVFATEFIVGYQSPTARRLHWHVRLGGGGMRGCSGDIGRCSGQVPIWLNRTHADRIILRSSRGLDS